MKSLMFTMTVAVALGYLLFARDLSDFGSRAVWPTLWPGQVEGSAAATVVSASDESTEELAPLAPHAPADPDPSLFLPAHPATVVATQDAVATPPLGRSAAITAADPVPTVVDVPLVVPDADPGDIGTVRPLPESGDLVPRPPLDTVLDARALRRLAADLEIAAFRARGR